MNYSLSKKKAKELVEAKLSHFMGVSPEEATDEQYYKAIALIVRDMMSQGRTEFSEKAAKAGTKRFTISAWNSSWDVLLKTIFTI